MNKIEDPDKRRFYLSLVADKKPYFMRYIYPDLMRQYNTYIKNTNKNAMREFRLNVDELYAIPSSERTERQSDFLRYYEKRMPVGTHGCVMNRICRRFEDAFDGYLKKHKPDPEFDYSIMKRGEEYSRSQYSSISKLYTNYCERLRNYAVFSSYERVDESDAYGRLLEMHNEFEQECAKVCPNRFALCDIILDVCYKKSSTKRFAWEMCGREIILNLLSRHGYNISFPTLSVDGNISYGGKSFAMETANLEECYESDPERVRVGREENQRP